MSFWQEVGASVGIGACTLEVELETPAVGWTEEAVGAVHLRGGSVPQPVACLTATVVQHWVTMTMVGRTPVPQHHYQGHAAAELARGLEIGPGEHHRLPFRLPAPWGGPFEHTWFIGATAQIPRAVDRGARATFKLLPPPGFLRIISELEDLSHLAVSGWAVRAGTGVRAILKPRDPEAHAVLDGITLDLFREGAMVRGEVVVNPQERSLGDVVRSLARADRRPTPFLVPERDLAALREVFERALRPDLDALARFPIPSERSADAEQLPRPGTPPEPDADDLPRPAGD
ncbi:MAG: sporulation protein [Armatimonadota bacterium]